MHSLRLTHHLFMEQASDEHIPPNIRFKKIPSKFSLQNHKQQLILKYCIKQENCMLSLYCYLQDPTDGIALVKYKFSDSNEAQTINFWLM